MTRRTLLTGTAILCPIAAILGLVSLSSVTIWDGNWEQEEYRLTFRGRGGRPVEGVQLRVESEAGTNFYHFPVADYLPGRIPASDAGGLLVFHHAPASGVSGRAWWLLGLVPMGEHHGPAYVCRFLLGGREVHRIRFGDLVNKGGPVVRRRWKWPTWPELQGPVFRGVEWDQTNDKRSWVFDLNGDGKLDREERYAATAAYRAQERAFELMARRKPEWEELEFKVVEREVALDVP